MRANPQTLIATLLAAVTQWCRREGLSRETVSQLIVEAHEQIDGPTTTGINFDPPSRDAYKRMAVNAERIFRWLNDATKETNLLPANFIPSVLAALPADLKIQALGELLVPLAVSVRLIAEEPDESGFFRHVHAVMKEGAEAQQAMVYLLDDTNQDRLQIAHRELSELLAAGTRALHQVEQTIHERATS